MDFSPTVACAGTSVPRQATAVISLHHQIPQPQPTNLRHLAQRRRDLLLTRIPLSRRERRQDARLLVLPRADHEREAELLAIRRVEPRELCDLLAREAIQVCRR